MDTHLLERDRQLTALTGAYAAVRAGAGRLTFVGGEAGAGKTALVRAFAARVPALAMLIGVCDPLETPRPLGPLLDMAPELERRVGRPMPRTGARDDLLAFIAAALGREADPPVLVFEDVHWADQATIDLLRYVGRRLERLHALVLATYREGETPAGGPVALLLGDLATAPGVGRLAVPPLSPAGTARMVAGTGLDPDRVHERTGGNPFFIGEVVRAGGEGVPPTVRDAVLARVARLPVPARHALEAAAAAGPRPRPALLLAVLQRTVPGWGLEEAVGAGLLAREGDELVFRHDLARSAIAGATGAARRAALHRLVLSELRRQAGGDGDPDELLRHAEAAGDDAGVLELAPRAAGRAEALHAHREAAALLQKAIDRSQGLAPDRLAGLLERQATELTRSGQLEAAIAAHRRAAAVRGARDPRRRGWNLGRVSRLCFLAGRVAESEAAHATALEALESLPPGPELAGAHEAAARVRFMEQDTAGAIELAELAEAVAAGAGDEALVLDARITAAALMREQYAAVVDVARRNRFPVPESGWRAEQVLAHVLATTELFLAVGAGVQRGERPDCGDPEVVADEVLGRRAAEAGGLDGLSARLEEDAARLVAHAESLTDEAATEVRFTVYHDGRQLVDEPRAWGKILAGHASFHLPLHLRQLEALATADQAPRA